MQLIKKQNDELVTDLHPEELNPTSLTSLMLLFEMLRNVTTTTMNVFTSPIARLIAVLRQTHVHAIHEVVKSKEILYL